jgi:tryptophanyl-tRNA synthetase
MSKSYNNTIPLWLPEKDLRKAILGIVTNSQAPGEPKNPDESHIFSIYQAFASADETDAMRKAFASGIGWGDAKQRVFERINLELAPMRERYLELMAIPGAIEERLMAGAKKAHALALPFVARLREAVGLRALSASVQEATPKAAPVARSAMTPVVFRDGDSAYAFKVLDAKKTVLAEQSGFASPREATDAAREAVKALESRVG